MISGNRPAADIFSLYPTFISFDGVLGTDYHTQALSRIAMLSAPFSQFSKWNGRDTIPGNQKSVLTDAIALAQDIKACAFLGCARYKGCMERVYETRSRLHHTPTILTNLASFSKPGSDLFSWILITLREC